MFRYFSNTMLVCLIIFQLLVTPMTLILDCTKCLYIDLKKGYYGFHEVCVRMHEHNRPIGPTFMDNTYQPIRLN